MYVETEQGNDACFLFWHFMLAENNLFAPEVLHTNISSEQFRKSVNTVFFSFAIFNKMTKTSY